MRRYTKSVNVRMEPHVDERIKEIIKQDPTCIQKGYSNSDLIRQFLRMGMTQYEKNLQHKLKIQRGEHYG